MTVGSEVLWGTFAASVVTASSPVETGAFAEVEGSSGTERSAICGGRPPPAAALRSEVTAVAPALSRTDAGGVWHATTDAHRCTSATDALHLYDSIVQ